MIKLYDPHHKRIEMGSPDVLAGIREFKVTADLASNSFFGQIENRIRHDEASHDEIHLWHKKISAGMTLRHWGLSRNTCHPKAPDQLDEAVIPMVLRDFQADFQALKAGSYARSGSTISLASPIKDGWFAHVIRGLKKDMGSHFYHYPFALVATSICNKLHVSMLHDSGRDFERVATANLASRAIQIQ